MYKKYRLTYDGGFTLDVEAADEIAVYRIALRVERSKQKKLKSVQEVGANEDCAV